MKSCCKEIMDNKTQDPTSKSWLNKLQDKWKVKSILHVILILCTFAIGGTLCSVIGKEIMNVLPIETKAIWLVVYIIIVTILWPICVIIISIFTGQFKFFKKYLSKLGNRIIGKK
jgi:hypothetical protein